MADGSLEGGDFSGALPGIAFHDLQGVGASRKQEFAPRRSVNERFRTLRFGLKRLARVEAELERKRKAEARRYNKSYPGELVHFDTKRLPLLKGEDATRPREYLFVAIDDFS